MKKILLFLLLVAAFSGCATYDACMKDPGCKKEWDEALAKGSTIGALVGTLGGPGAAAGGGLAGSGLAGLAVLYAFNKKLKRKKKVYDGTFAD